jgi:serine/threonine-protein kinase RsbT
MHDDARHMQVIRRESDIVEARQRARALAKDMGFDHTDQALIATAISELARNIVNYAGEGEIEFRPLAQNSRHGLEVIASDNGPGIVDIESAMQDGYSTGNSLGLGLPGTRRIVDVFEIESAPGEGVRVHFVKWKR